MAHYVSSVELPCSAQALRRFLGRPANLPQITNPELELEIVAAPEEVAVGETIEFRITAYGFKQRATHEYTEVTDSTIVESQIDGAMRAWTQSQRIEPLSPGACRLTDEFDFERPGGMMGFLLTEARIREALNEGMEFRYSVMKELISSGVIA